VPVETLRQRIETSLVTLALAGVIGAFLMILGARQ
jgi:hypothetical protein